MMAGAAAGTRTACPSMARAAARWNCNSEKGSRNMESKSCRWPRALKRLVLQALGCPELLQGQEQQASKCQNLQM